MHLPSSIRCLVCCHKRKSRLIGRCDESLFSRCFTDLVAATRNIKLPSRAVALQRPERPLMQRPVMPLMLVLNRQFLERNHHGLNPLGPNNLCLITNSTPEWNFPHPCSPHHTLILVHILQPRLLNVSRFVGLSHTAGELLIRSLKEVVDPPDR